MMVSKQYLWCDMNTKNKPTIIHHDLLKAVFSVCLLSCCLTAPVFAQVPSDSTVKHNIHKDCNEQCEEEIEEENEEDIQEDNDEETEIGHTKNNDQKKEIKSDQSPQRNTNRDFGGIIMENDMWGLHHTDESYTDGIRVRFYNRQLEEGYVLSLLHAIHGSRLDGPISAVSEIGQNMYTPDDITIESVDSLKDRRPYAAYLYIGNQYTFSPQGDPFYHKMSYGLQLGVVGRKSLGREAQSIIHEYISHSPQPMGWDQQIHDQIVLQFYWIGEAKLISKRYFDFTMRSGIHFGNLFINANNKYTIRLGLFGNSELTQDVEAKVVEENQIDDDTSSDPIKLYSILSWTPYIVYHNATITGSIGENNPVEHSLPHTLALLNDYQIGLGVGLYACDIGEFLLEWKHTWRTAEYRSGKYKDGDLFLPQHNFGSYQLILKNPL